MKQRYGITLALLAVLACSVQAGAVTVGYSVGGVGPAQYPGPVTPPANAPWGPSGYPGDTVELQTFSGTLVLVPGTYVKKINTILWTIDYTYGGTATDPDAWSDVNFSLNVPRSITLHTSSGTLAQTGTLQCTWENDFLGLNAGPTVAFNISGVAVYVTPLGTGPLAGFFGKASAQLPQHILCNLPCVQPEHDLYAEFVVDGIVPVERMTWMRVKSLYR